MCNRRVWRLDVPIFITYTYSYSIPNYMLFFKCCKPWVYNFCNIQKMTVFSSENS